MGVCIVCFKCSFTKKAVRREESIEALVPHLVGLGSSNSSILILLRIHTERLDGSSDWPGSEIGRLKC